MKKFLFIFLSTSYLLLASTLPTTIKTTISNITKSGEIQLSTAVPKGMSGIVIHDYGNGLSAITHASLSLGGDRAAVTPYTAILHENIPTIKTAVEAGDKVIFGNFYDNALVIAPNQKIYNQVTQHFKKVWIHPDAYALEFMKNGESKLTLDSLKNFSEKNQIGLVLIVTKTQLLILDPLSKQFLGSMPLEVNVKEAVSPFYARFEQMDVSVFGFSKKSYDAYFQSVARLK